MRKPDIHEQSLFKILEDTVKKIFADFFYSYPDCLIIDNNSSVYNGTTNLFKNEKILYNNRGYRFRYTLENIAIKKSSLAWEGLQKLYRHITMSCLIALEEMLRLYSAVY